MNLVKIQQISHFFYRRKLKLISRLFEFLIFLIYNSRVPASVIIGKNTKFAYLGIGCVLHKDTIIGDNCIIGQGITIGGRGPRKGAPIIGNNVYLGPGCRILGPINIGNNCIIGPNAVVIENINSGCIAVGIPTKIVKSGLISIDEYL